MITVYLPWPNGDLWPNARVYRFRLHRARKDQHLEARLLTRDSMRVGQTIDKTAAEIPIRYTFHAPTRRRYDRDNALAAMKAAQDGIAEALGIDDSRFEPITLRRGDTVKGGAVMVEIGT